MVVLDMNILLSWEHWKKVFRKLFSIELGFVDIVSIFGGEIAYNYQYIHQTYILIIHHDLYITIMQHNLITLILVKSGGVIVKNIPKKHSKDPTSSNLCISSERNDLKILLKLSGTFSYLYSRPLYVKEQSYYDKVFMTPDINDSNPKCKYCEKMIMQWLTLRVTLCKLR